MMELDDVDLDPEKLLRDLRDLAEEQALGFLVGVFYYELASQLLRRLEPELDPLRREVSDLVGKLPPIQARLAALRKGYRAIVTTKGAGVVARREAEIRALVREERALAGPLVVAETRLAALEKACAELRNVKPPDGGGPLLALFQSHGTYPTGPMVTSRDHGTGGRDK